MSTGLPAILHRIYQCGSEQLCCITIAPIPREREPRGATQPLAKPKTTRFAAKPLLRCLNIFDSLILHVPAGDQNSERAQESFRRPPSPGKLRPQLLSTEKTSLPPVGPPPTRLYQRFTD